MNKLAVLKLMLINSLYATMRKWASMLLLDCLPH